MKHRSWLTKLSVLFLSAMLLFTAGCGSSDVSSSDSSSAGGSDIEFWLDKMGDAEIKTAIEEAWAADAGFNIAVENYPDTASFQTAIQQVLTTSEAPELFTWWSGSQLETLAKNGQVVDLTDEWEHYIASGISPDIKEAFTVDGKAYAAPYSILYNVIIYNKDAFDKAGITEEPKTFDEFLDVCAKLKDAGITPIGLKNDSWASFIWFQQFIAAYDPQLYIDICNGTKDYTDPDVVKVMEIWKDMIDKGYFSEPVLYSDNFRAFAEGEVAMVLEPSTAVTDLSRDYGLVSGEGMDVMGLPSMSGGKEVIFFEASPILIPAANENQDKAKEALRSFYKEGTQNALAESTGITNTNKVTIDDYAINKTIEMAGNTDDYKLILRYYENTPEEIRDLALDELSKFMYTGAPIDEVLDNIQQKADQVFGN